MNFKKEYSPESKMMFGSTQVSPRETGKSSFRPILLSQKFGTRLGSSQTARIK